MKLIATGGLIAALGMPAGVRAQTSPDPPVTPQVSLASAPARPLRSAIARHAGELARADVAVRSSDSDRSWAARHPILLGTIIGAGGGAVAAAIACRHACEGDPKPYMLLFAGVGAGIGAGVGGVISAATR